MGIGNIVNKYGEDHTPYIGEVVNHLPMAQWAMYNISNDLESVERLSRKMRSKLDGDKNKQNFIKIDSIDECLGKRYMYESCLDYVRREVEKKGLEDYLVEIINDYDLGLSSGVYHPIIRLGYAMEGYKHDRDYKAEVERALAYYITSYRETKIFKRKKKNISHEDEINFFKATYIKDLISKEKTLGKRIKTLLNDDIYMEKGFLIDGDIDYKIKTFINLTSRLYDNSLNIVALHCITGLHGIILLKDYYKDFERTLDIATTSMATHILATDIEYKDKIEEEEGLSWNYLKALSMSLLDPHSIKLVYSSEELDRLYDLPELKVVVYDRLQSI